MYKLIISVSDKGYEDKGLVNLFNNIAIPFDPANTDYQAYLKWVEEGNTPLPAEGTE
jgi:hypothetical protein